MNSGKSWRKKGRRKRPAEIRQSGRKNIGLRHLLKNRPARKRRREEKSMMSGRGIL